ncbi:putative Protein kinase domain containing protein [Blattamonas nauphoetae]|uniref:non-specific serine/threonine protein kinase n=1 Tax=Blattamonas nauphoetae TaxID=2049346 RepID=A0ABQ9Y557_9EUKA|nr:putative Protein kinase domain containing protein [Blattamonas nauphoetae]
MSVIVTLSTVLSPINSLQPPQPESFFHPIQPSAPPAEERETLVVEPSAPTAEEEASHEMTEMKKDAEEEKQADEDLHQPSEVAESIEEGRHAQEHRKRGLSRASSSFPLTQPEEENERRLALDDVVKDAEQRWDEREGSAKSAVQQLTQMELFQIDREEQMPKIDEDLTEQYEKDLRAMKDPFDRALREQDEREAELDLLAEEGHDMKQTWQEQIQETVDLIRHEKEDLLKAMAECREEKEKERGRIDESGRIERRRLSEAVDALREELGSLQYQIQILKEEKAKLQETRPKAATQPQQQPLSPRWETTIGKTRQSHQILSTPFSRQSDRGPTATPISPSSFLGLDTDTRKDQTAEVELSRIFSWQIMFKGIDRNYLTMTQKQNWPIPQGYKLVRSIDEKGARPVLQIKEYSTGKSFALKLFPGGYEEDQKLGANEVLLLERFRHPRIVGLHESVTVQICIDIAEGLCVLHNHPTHPTTHGNLRPENVLLTKDNRTMLCDLEMSAYRGYRLYTVMEKKEVFECCSPEYEYNKAVPPASDIWSLGVMLCRMVTGKPLFAGKSYSEIFKQIEQFDESKIPTSLPPNVRDILVRLLDTNPDSRPTATQLFKGRQLQRILGPETPLSKMHLNQNQVLERELAELQKEHKSLQKRTAKLETIVESLGNVQLPGLPPVTVFPPQSFQIKDQTFTRLPPVSEDAFEGMVAISEPISRGIVSISITLNSLLTDLNLAPFIFITPKKGSLSSLGDPMQSAFSVCFKSSNGHLRIPSSWMKNKEESEQCHQQLKAGDTVVLEVDMEANPHTVQFFVNGKTGKRYVSCLPDSVRVMMITPGEGTSFRLNSVTQLTKPSPLPPYSMELRC